MQKQVKVLLQKEMSRKEFMTTIGVGVAAIMGFSSLLQMLNVKQFGGAGNLSSYGSSPYGGKRTLS